MKQQANCETDERYEYIYVAFITRKNGFRDYARKHGLKAWRIRVPKHR